MTDRNEKIADLMMGAAFADKRLDGREMVAVRKLLAQAMGADTIGDTMEARLKAFRPSGFDPAATARGLGLTSDDDKRNLLELISAVTEADKELDLDESEYLEKVAGALDLPRQTFTDLTMEVLSVENIAAVGKKLMPPPPKRG